MTLAQLRAFLAAVRAGSFTGAARELVMSQASVSELVRRLEDEAGTELFVRGARRLALTAAGRELAPYAEQAVTAADAGARAVAAVGSLEGGTASFGLLRNADHYLLSDLAERFCREHPAVRARLVGQNSAEVAAAVVAGDLEAGLAVLPIDDEGLVVTPLLRDEVVWVSAEPARTAAPVTIEDVAAAPLVLYDAHYGWRDPTRRQLAERAALAGVRLDVRVEVEHAETALKLVARGLGDTLVSRAVVRSAAFPVGLHVASFAEPLFDTVALVVRRDAVLSPATREIVRIAREMLGA